MGEKITYARKSQEEKKQEVEALAKKIDEGVIEYLNSDKYKQLLQNISQFWQYSFNNCFLIMVQKQDATRCASFAAWKNKFHRNIKAGEKGIKILYPQQRKIMVEQNKLDPKTRQPLYDEDGNRIKEKVEKTYTTFGVGHVFDIAQTEPDPKKEFVDIEMVKELAGSVEGHKDFVEALTRISKADIEFGEIRGGAKGYYSSLENLIKIKDGMAQQQQIKTLTHELVHSRLHNDESELKNIDPHLKEIQAESCAYVICNHFGIDTSEYSFPYIASWASQDVDDIKKNLEIIKDTSTSLINQIEFELDAIKMSRGLEYECESRAKQIEQAIKDTGHKRLHHRRGL